MTTTSRPASVLFTLLLLFALGSLSAQGQEKGTTGATGGQLEQAYRKAIATMESSDGAYAEGLSESLLSLARTLQSQGRHDEAIDVFKRGTHLTRVNDGLYCEQQIPLVQGEIGSHVAKGNYALADERQRYLARVQVRSLGSSKSLTTAFMQQAKWQFQAYQLGLDQLGYTRLINMWEYYGRAREDVIAREGDTSPNLLPPLYGMLQAQYLISGYKWVEPAQSFAEGVRLDPEMVRFKSYRAKSYQQGSTVIADIYDIEQEHFAQDKLTLAQTLVMLGDWHLWNGDTEAAWQAYGKAETELAGQDDAQSHAEQLFGEPVPLPDFAALRSLPSSVDPDEANIMVAFGVNERGRVEDLERLDEDDEYDSQARRLMRTLRHTKFRPRFEAGEPIETEKLVKAFSIQ
jgi:tetratricopeptide (TPR) repeat protein